MNGVIVTGGNGFIGRHLVKKLIECKPPSVVIISNSPSTDGYSSEQKLLHTPLTYYTEDIRDKKALLEIFQNEKAETCIHLAGKISVIDSIKNPDETMDINVNGTVNVLEACYQTKVKNFVFASSAAVYGDVRELPISEKHVLAPLSPYGRSKMLAEQHVLSYNKLKKLQNTASFRIFNVYGQGQTSESDVITKFVARLSKGLPPIIYGDGSQTRDFISVDDVVEGILLTIKAMEEMQYNSTNSMISSPIFNLGMGIPTSINGLVQKMISMFGVDLQPIYKEVNESERGILHSYADMTKSREILNIVPKKSIDIGLKEIIEPMLLQK